ncbi:MAG: DUF367 family protein [Crenarchaeota archaeon]|nr:DUF367 family protein [Thermoproteota archaeon]
MVRVFILYLRQDDPKKNTALRLAKFGLAEIVRDMREVPRGMLVLDPFAREVVKPEDRDIVEKRGILAIDCSWSRSISTFNRIRRSVKGFRRRLPFLVSANPSHYGKPYMLTTAEAIAAALYIVGLKELAEKILSLFKWGPEFIRINYDRLEEYSRGNMEIEKEYFEYSNENVFKILREFHDVD